MSPAVSADTRENSAPIFFQSEEPDCYTSAGQNHDRIPIEEQSTASMSSSSSGSTDITLTQRMICATVGSVLTSSLGILNTHPRPCIASPLTDLGQSLLSTLCVYDYNRKLPSFLLSISPNSRRIRPLSNNSLPTSASQHVAEKFSSSATMLNSASLAATLQPPQQIV